MSCCQSTFQGVRCDLPEGHDKFHLNLSENGDFILQEWDNNGQDPKQSEYGHVVRVNYGWGRDHRLLAYAFAKIDAEIHLPKGTIYETRCTEYPKEGKMKDFGREPYPLEEQCQNWGIAWLSGPYIENDSAEVEHDVDDGAPNVPGGYILLARLRAKGDVLDFAATRRLRDGAYVHETTLSEELMAWYP